MTEDHLCHWQRCKTNYVHKAADIRQHRSSRSALNSWRMSAPGRVLWGGLAARRKAVLLCDQSHVKPTDHFNLTLCLPNLSEIGTSPGSLGSGEQFQVRY